MNYEILLLVMLLIMAFVLGFTFDSVWSKPNGELIIDTSDPEKDKWLFRLNEPPKYVSRRHIVKLKVTHGQIEEDEVNGGT